MRDRPYGELSRAVTWRTKDVSIGVPCRCVNVAREKALDAQWLSSNGLLASFWIRVRGSHRKRTRGHQKLGPTRRPQAKQRLTLDEDRRIDCLKSESEMIDKEYPRMFVPQRTEEMSEFSLQILFRKFKITFLLTFDEASF